MYNIEKVAHLISSIAFIGYGLGCLTLPQFKIEFQRYGLAKLRTLIGVLEVLGGVGLLFGFFNPQLKVLSEFCLALLMFFAVLVRLKIRDSLASSLPAIVLLLLNVFIALN